MKLSLHTDIKTLSVKFKLKNIERATNESIMFLLAIVNSYKNESIKNIHYSGDVPIKESVKRMFIESGFLNYCRTNNMGNLQTSENKIQIKYGNGYYKPNDFISVYDWISRDINVAKHYTKDLSGIINEIIGNAVEHAYPKSNNNFKQKNWYFYAEKKEKHIEFIALDPGVGMPQTMKKNFFEKIFQWTLNTDAKLIESALLGIFRTKTEERNRGNGLPKIYNSVVKGKISNLQILSQKGYCFIEKNGNIFTENKHKGFPGTLYKWELKVEE
ncbi:MAG: hypothetical protein SOR77_05925 [Peptoniphilus sp.]|uniref:hypothetical protein n=1 Tax=Peptoniphilus sp. TaxID=1971214 RepID=UPI002A74E307|nr:hypothetical protein [Peptoniphilus sp.]MDY2987158.1 hypothetical protein [Peptoniphilus sp.]